jgi:PAS domain S-box-containing protein
MTSRPAQGQAEDEKVNILLVDDDPKGLVALATVLEGLGQNLVTARSGQEALRHVLSTEFAVVLLDVQMPLLDGFETAALIRARDRSRHIPILFLTASYKDDAQMFRGYAVGGVDYVLKPLVPEVLRSKVSVFVELAKKEMLLQRQASRLHETQQLLEEHAHDLERKVEERTRDLGQAEEKYRLLVEQIPAAIYLANPDKAGEVAYFSPQIETLLGFPPEDWIADRDLWNRATHPDDCQRVDAEFGRLRATGEPVSSEYRMLARDGRVVWVRDEARLVPGPGGAARVVQGVIVDITEGKRAREAIERQRETLYQTEKLAAMGQLLAGVAHELNNPLAVLMGQASLLRRSAHDGPLAPRAAQIEQAADRCTRIVRNFLALARQRPPERAQVGVNQVVREALELLSYPLRVDGVELDLDLAEGLPILWADAHQLQQVIVNLVTNAHHAVVAGSPPRRITLTTRADAVGHGVVLEVADTGPGISPEVQARIFEPFFTTKPVGEGTGLGLSLCRGVVESHGGSISVQNAPGHGTVFRIHLPVLSPPADADDPQPACLPRVEGKSILVVDDEELLADLVAEMLSEARHRVDIAGSGQAALERLDASAYDMVVSDIRMPGMDGPSLWRETCRRHPRLEKRFLFLTGDTLAPGTREFLEETQSAYLGKPFTDADLHHAIAQVLSPAAPSRP